MPSSFSCPDCHGVLNQVPDRRVLRFRCRTGHAWTSQSLMAEQDEQVEESLWIALRVLEERADLSRRLGQEAEQGGQDWTAGHHATRAAQADRAVDVIKQVLGAELSSAERGAPATGT